MAEEHRLVKLKNLYTMKLDRTNFFAWKAQVLTHMRRINLLPYIEEKLNYNGTLSTQQDQLLLGWIFSMITPSILLSGKLEWC